MAANSTAQAYMDIYDAQLALQERIATALETIATALSCEQCAGVEAGR